MRTLNRSIREGGAATGPSGLPTTMCDAIAKGLLPGPRILTAIEPLTERGEQTGAPDEIRAYVRRQKEAGADLIKIYASGGMRQGGNLVRRIGLPR